ncbi:transposase [Rosistilla oblonga]|uniref:transposase n=1 Tax=Rosistilla oblonga TaxID=2527990 RepID=UPI003A971390
MAQANIPDGFYQIAIRHLPPEPTVGPDGGGPVIDHYRGLRVILYVLVTGVCRGDVPEEMGCSGETARCRLRDWQDAGVQDRLQLDMLRLLRRDGELQHETAIIDST